MDGSNGSGRAARKAVRDEGDIPQTRSRLLVVGVSVAAAGAIVLATGIVLTSGPTPGSPPAGGLPNGVGLGAAGPVQLGGGPVPGGGGTFGPRPSAPGTSAANPTSPTTAITPTGARPTQSAAPDQIVSTTSPAPRASASPAGPQPPSGYGTVDLALNRPAGSTDYTQVYAPANITDGNTSSYWEGQANEFPETVTVDLGSVQWVAKMELALPPAPDWNSRTQTIAIYGSTSGPGRTSQTIVPSAGYSFNADDSSQDTVTVAFPAVQTRYLTLEFTANSGWDAAQLAELFVYS